MTAREGDFTSMVADQTFVMAAETSSIFASFVSLLLAILSALPGLEA